MTERMTIIDLQKAQTKRVDREGPIHIDILQHLRKALPGAVIHHSPNETKWRSKKAIMVVQKAKSMGTMPGFPDLMILFQGQFWAMEVKAEGGKVSMAQKAAGIRIEAAGGRWAVVRSVEDAEKCLSKWMDEMDVDIPFRGKIS